MVDLVQSIGLVLLAAAQILAVRHSRWRGKPRNLTAVELYGSKGQPCRRVYADTGVVAFPHPGRFCDCP